MSPQPFADIARPFEAETDRLLIGIVLHVVVKSILDFHRKMDARMTMELEDARPGSLPLFARELENLFLQRTRARVLLSAYLEILSAFEQAQREPRMCLVRRRRVQFVGDKTPPPSTSPCLLFYPPLPLPSTTTPQ